MLPKWGVVLITLFISLVLSVSACSVVQGGESLSREEAIEDGASEALSGRHYATNYLWHESDVFDLNSSLGTFVRAYIESMLRMGVDGGKEALFPGAEEATSFDMSFLERAAVDNPAGPSGRRGVIDLLVLAVNENVSESEIIVCEDPSGVAGKIGTGEWQALGTETHTRVQISRLVVDMAGDSPPSNVVGRAQYPRESVFGDWKAIEYDPALDPDSVSEQGINFESQCLGEVGKEKIPSKMGGYIVPEPPIEATSPEPGWPEGKLI